MCILIIPFQDVCFCFNHAAQHSPVWPSLLNLAVSFLHLQVNLCLLQASVEEGSPSCTNKCITHVSLVALCFDRIATQFRMNRYCVNYSVCSFMQLCFLIRGKCTCSTKMTKVCSAQTHISVGPCRGIVEETPNTTEHGRPSVMLEKYASATKMQPQSSGSLRSNAGIEKGKEIAARLNIHRIHSQLRGLDSTGQIGI